MCRIHETWKKNLPAVDDLLGGGGGGWGVSPLGFQWSTETCATNKASLPAAEKHFSLNENIFMVILK